MALAGYPMQKNGGEKTGRLNEPELPRFGTGTEKI